jgi:predicted peroxiredoxin
MASTEKLVIMVTHGPGDPEQATIPFVMAVGALASEVQVVVGLQGAGVELALKGAADAIAVEGFPPLAKLMADYKAMGGKLLACPPSVNKRHIEAATQFVDNAEVIGAGRFIVEFGTASHVLVY